MYAQVLLKQLDGPPPAAALQSPTTRTVTPQEDASRLLSHIAFPAQAQQPQERFIPALHGACHWSGLPHVPCAPAQMCGVASKGASVELHPGGLGAVDARVSPMQLATGAVDKVDACSLVSLCGWVGGMSALCVLS